MLLRMLVQVRHRLSRQLIACLERNLGVQDDFADPAISALKRCQYAIGSVHVALGRTKEKPPAAFTVGGSSSIQEPGSDLLSHRQSRH